MVGEGLEKSASRFQNVKSLYGRFVVEFVIVLALIFLKYNVKTSVSIQSSEVLAGKLHVQCNLPIFREAY